MKTKINHSNKSISWWQEAEVALHKSVSSLGRAKLCGTDMVLPGIKVKRWTIEEEIVYAKDPSDKL